jgi:hypothetical protein
MDLVARGPQRNAIAFGGRIMSCNKIFEVELAREGRLVLDVAHVAQCEDCQREVKAFSNLQTQLKSEDSIDTQRLARVRHRLLSKNQGNSFQPYFYVAGAVAAVLAIWVIGKEPWVDVNAKPLQPATLSVVPNGTAQWSSQATPTTEDIKLTKGILKLSVQRPVNGKRLIVHVPDGEIEDIGTVFEVEVEGDKTKRVSVAEGIVKISLVGRASIELHAGESFNSATPPTVVAAQKEIVQEEPVPSNTVPLAAPSVAPIATIANDNRVRSRTKTEVSANPRHEMTPVVESVVSEPTPEIPRAAVATPIERAPQVNNREALDEDAEYVLFLDSVKDADLTVSKERAREFLRHFPQAFRAREVEAFLESH